jgi:hypothetical protein
MPVLPVINSTEAPAYWLAKIALEYIKKYTDLTVSIIQKTL